MKDEKPLASIHASAGPWWGFNGVRTLFVTEAALYIARNRVSWVTRRPPAVQRVSRRDVQLVEADVKPRHAVVRVRTRDRRLTLRAEEGNGSPGVEKFVRSLQPSHASE